MGKAERIARHCRTALGLTLTGFLTRRSEELADKLEASIKQLLSLPDTLQSVCRTHSE